MRNPKAKTQNNSIKRKIYVYEIYCQKKSIDENQKFDYTEKLFNEIEKNKNSIEYNNISDNRWYSVEKVNFSTQFIDCTLICCKYNYMPNLINVEDRSERNSPKKSSEGDKEKTHITIKDNVIAYEQRRNGTSATILMRLMNIAWNNIRDSVDPSISKIILRQVVEDDFLEIINKANRIKNAKFLVSSTLINSEYFNFSNDSGVDDLYTLEIKATRKKSINKTSFIDKIERILAEKEKIEKVTVDIIDEDNNPRVINTEEISKQFNIDVGKNSNGEVIDVDIFSKLKELI